MHGDSLCTRDEAYMKLRRYLRNPITLFILRHLPLSTRHKLGRKLRSESRAQTRMKANDIVDVTPEEVPRIMQHYGVKTLIHGHTHRPAIHKLQIGEQSAKRIVLGGIGIVRVGRCRWMRMGLRWRLSTSPRRRNWQHPQTNGQTQNPCGSGLAREGGFTFSISVDCHTAFASKPAPTLTAFCLNGLPRPVPPSPQTAVSPATPAESTP